MTLTARSAPPPHIRCASTAVAIQRKSGMLDSRGIGTPAGAATRPRRRPTNLTPGHRTSNAARCRGFRGRLSDLADYRPVLGDFLGRPNPPVGFLVLSR